MHLRLPLPVPLVQALLLLLDLLLGVVLGVLGGLFGSGGGMVAIPVLGLLFGLDQMLAQGTALVMVVPNVLLALWRYHQRNRIDWRQALTYLRAFVQPSWLCGLDGDFSWGPLRDWPDHAERAALLNLELWGGAKSDLIRSTSRSGWECVPCSSSSLYQVFLPTPGLGSSRETTGEAANDLRRCNAASSCGAKSAGASINRVRVMRGESAAAGTIANMSARPRATKERYLIVVRVDVSGEKRRPYPLRRAKRGMGAISNAIAGGISRNNW